MNLYWIALKRNPTGINVYASSRREARDKAKKEGHRIRYVQFVREVTEKTTQ